MNTSHTFCLLSCLCFSGFATERLPLVNADFELGSSGWTGDGGKSVVCPQAAHAGHQGLRVTDNDPTNGSSFRSSTVPAIAGRTYRLRFWAHIPQESSGQIGVYMDFKDKDGKRLPQATGRECKYDLSCVPVWRQLDYVEIAPTGAVSLSIWIHSFAATTGLIADFDEFELSCLSPEEAQDAHSTWLRITSPFPQPSPQRIAEIAAMLDDQLWKPGVSIHDRAVWERLAAMPGRHVIISRAEAILQTPPPPMSDERYLDFSRTGVRTTYESTYHLWEPQMQTLAVAECLENRGRFLPEIIRRLDSLCDMRSWLMPAHDADLLNFHNIECYADLGSSARGWTVMAVDTWLDDKLPQSLRDRLRAEIDRRILAPYLRVLRSGSRIQGLWWMEATNNWNAVCTNNTIGMALALVQDKHTRAEFLAGMEISNRFFLKGFAKDGFCSEGVSYWGFGFGHFMCLADTVLQATKGRLNILTEQPQLLERISRYGTEIQMTRRLTPPFADCRLSIFPFKEVLLLIQRHFPQALTQRVEQGTPLGHTMPSFDINASDGKPVYVGSSGLVLERIPFFGLLGFGDESRYAAALPASAPLPEHSFFPDGGVLICRPGEHPHNRLTIALKGGHNNENHNHNDIGSIVVGVGDVPVIQDPGREEYSGQTFGINRYQFHLMNSWGHAVPIVAGTLQQSGANAKGVFRSTEFTPDTDTAVLDLSSAYNVPALQSLTRRLTYERSNGRIVIADSVTFTSPQNFGTALITFAAIRQTAPNEFLLTKDGATLKAAVSCDAAPVAFHLTPLETQNPFIPQRLGFDLQSAVVKATITIVLTEP